MELCCYEPVLVKPASLKREVKKSGHKQKGRTGTFFFSHQLLVRKGTGTARCGSLKYIHPKFSRRSKNAANSALFSSSLEKLSCIMGER